MNAIIVTGGDIDISLLENYIAENKEDIIISVDAAITKLEKINLIPHIMVGDFDTLSDDDRLKKYAELDVEIVKHDPVKDFSDSELAVDRAVKVGIKTISVFGALGKRFDHAFANILILQKYKKLGVDITIYDKYNKIYVKSNHFILERGKLWGKYISFFSLEEKNFMEKLEGVKYPIENRIIDNIATPSLYISNEIKGDKLKATFSGDLLVVESRD
ncbi:thiamine diphosphokinase [Lachnoanaerobaculum gingivalis]|jgi:thiamine diphosphokinase|uniref:thiamine diphosphokinase n=1 Tax=Lachnoanaerobaculum gingivalis TaxID=2490855 RepID=UPI0028D5BA86|nr:thiamine diphosphokinase [Lachnoanaerobaculum gingivalis]